MERMDIIGGGKNKKREDCLFRGRKTVVQDQEIKKQE